MRPNAFELSGLTAGQAAAQGQAKPVRHMDRDASSSRKLGPDSIIQSARPSDRLQRDVIQMNFSKDRALKNSPAHILDAQPHWILRHPTQKITQKQIPISYSAF